MATRGAVVVPEADVHSSRTSSAPGSMLTRRPSKPTIRVYAALVASLVRCLLHPFVLVVSAILRAGYAYILVAAIQQP